MMNPPSPETQLRFRSNWLKCFSLSISLWLFLAGAPISAQLERNGSRLAVVEALNGKTEMVTYRGRRAVHLVHSPDHEGTDDAIIAILGGSEFSNGIIEADVAGAPRSDTPADSRGFIGISFHVQPHASRFETIYLRPTNGRSDEQGRRNHSVQYSSDPDFPWYRLREENPGVYESYVDLEAGAWTRMKIVVSGTIARLYVNGALQPCLIVKDLKMGEASGKIALWAHWTTDAYFSNLRVKTGSSPAR
jgi:hypothetical protein